MGDLILIMGLLAQCTRGTDLLRPNPACRQIKHHRRQEKIPEHMDIFSFQDIG
jgi:hypothetical protein